MSTFSGSNDNVQDIHVPNACLSDDDGDDDEICEISKERVEKAAPPSKRKKRAPTMSSNQQKKPPLPTDVSGTSSQSRPRKKKSPYWAHYDDTSDVDVAKCKYCGALIGCASRHGTTPLKNHVERCKMAPANVDLKQKIIDFEKKTIVKEDGSIETQHIPKLWDFDQESCRKSLAKMIIIDELPFIFVEREGFRNFCKDLNPAFHIPSRKTVTRDCYCLYIDERKRLIDVFKSLSSRVCLTTDTWTSGQNLSYMCLTAHFIDENWKLHKKILNFCSVPGHSGEVIGQSIEKCLIEWGIQRILTVTVDNASSNDVAIQYLKRRLNHRGTNVLNGDYLHMRCAAHILNLVVKDGLKDVDDSIMKIRNSVKYVRSSPSRLQKFKACALEEGLDTKSLVCLDVDTRWNSTYLMLESALKFKKAFTNMHSRDSTCVKELRKYGGKPEEEDWNKVKLFVPFLQIFYDATLRLSGSRYVTANSYVFDIYGLGQVISHLCGNEDEGVRNMAIQMKSKHDKYWGNVNNLNVFMFVSLVLDPQRKFKYVDWILESSYGEEESNLLSLKIRVTMRDLFESYASSIPSSKKTYRESSSSSSSPSLTSKEIGEMKQVMNFANFLTSKFQREKGGDESERKNELEKYLSESCENDDQNFNILQWWKDRAKTYPILQLMARDVLAIPVSTVASESAFSTGGRVLDSFRTSLSPKMVEAVVCAQDWFRTSHGPLFIEENLLELENMEDGMKELVMEQPTITIDESLDFTDA